MTKPAPWLIRHDRHITRIAATVLSLAGFGFGGYCTLETENEVGTAAAYFVGLFFSIVAITGGVPRLKIGDNEIDPTSVAVGALAVAEAANEKAKQTDDPEEVAEASRDAVVALWTVASKRRVLAEGDADARIWAKMVDYLGHTQAPRTTGHSAESNEPPEPTGAAPEQ